MKQMQAGMVEVNMAQTRWDEELVLVLRQAKPLLEKNYDRT